MGVVALDGTKVAANAALNRSYALQCHRLDTCGARGRVAPRAGATVGASQALGRPRPPGGFRSTWPAAGGGGGPGPEETGTQAQDGGAHAPRGGQSQRRTRTAGLKTRQGYLQGYNVQAVVSEDQIIVAIAVTQEANDVQQLLPMLNESEPGSSGDCRTSWHLADAGYWSEARRRDTGVVGGHHQRLEATKGSAGTGLSPRTYS